MKSAPVWVWLPDAADPIEAGALYRNDDGTGLFTYADQYRQQGHRPLDPKELRHLSVKVKHRFRANERDGMPGIIADAGPDYWGRYVLSQELGRELDAFDALVFAPQDSFGNLAVGDLDKKQTLHCMELPKLAQAIQLRLEGNPIRTHTIEDMMLSPDTALGGTKPKATVMLEGFPWIAKFPDKGDSPDLPYYEAAAMRMAALLGIEAAVVKVEKLPGDKSVLLVKRFDRRPDQSRIAAASALTVMGPAAEVKFTEARTYNNFLARAREWAHPAQRDELGPQIWTRIAYNGLVANMDDHPRNHAMINVEGWRLAPLFDVVPGITHREQLGLALPFFTLPDGQRSAAVTAENLVKASVLFGLTMDQAHTQLISMAETLLRGWKDVLEALEAPDRVHEATQATLEWASTLLAQARALNLQGLKAARKRRSGWSWAP